MTGLKTGRSLLWLAILALVGSLGACAEDEPEPGTPLVGGPDVTGSAEMSLEEADIVATRDGASVTVRIPIQRLGDAALPVMVDVALRDLDRLVLGEASRPVTLEDDVTEVVVVIDGLDPEWTIGDLNNAVIHYQILGDNSLLFGRRSLYTATRKRAIHLVSSDTFYDGQSTFLRLVATDPVTDQPLADATVDVYLVDADDDAELMFTGQTDDFGTLSAPVEATTAQIGSQNLRVVVDSELGMETIERPVQVRRDQRILITTDKPLYQPGQTIHIRTLTLRRGDLLPAAGETIVVEVLDGRGNKILRHEAVTDDFGIAATELKLARELNMGEFIIRATLDQTTSERTVTVDRYTLPRFAISLSPDASFYEPGQQALVQVQADYLFGEPVAGGEILANMYQVEAGNETFIGQANATLSGEGAYPLEVTIPTLFNSATLRSGDAFIRIAVTVIDGAGEERDASVVLPVASSGIVVVVVPAHDLLPDTINEFHVLTSDPTGRPVAVDCYPTGNEDDSFTTDARGAARLSVVASGMTGGALSLALSCADDSGSRVDETFTFQVQSSQQGALAVFTDQSLYRAGGSVEVSVTAVGVIDRLFLDVIANNRTLSTTAMDVVDGEAQGTIDLPLDVTGAVDLTAYTFADDGGIIRAQRLVYVEPANDLTVSFEADRAEYRPGDPATIDVTVTDGSGEGVTAAVGLTVVDEAVFALQDMRPGAERLFFQLEQEVLTPQYDVHGFDIGEVVDSDASSSVERNQAAEILFAASQGSPGYGIVVDSLAEHIARANVITSGRLDADLQLVLTTELQRHQGEDYAALYEQAAQIIESFNGRYVDPWGQPYRFEGVAHYGDEPDSFDMTGAGPDEAFDTADDVTTLVWFDQVVYGATQAEDEFDNMDGGGPMAGGGGGGGAPAPPGGGELDDDGLADPTDERSGGADAPRVRRFFPETLLVEPALITDSDGRASLPVTMADSITTWRVTGMASSQAGQLGSASSGIRVFQPFFVDIDFPPTLTQNDEVEVPVAVFNFLDTSQEVEITVDEPAVAWYELLSPATETLTLDPGEVTSVPFRVRVSEVGVHGFQVTAIGSELSDAVVRSVQVLPDGEEHTVNISDRLSQNVTVSAHIPASAIPNASVLMVKVYPGLFSQVVEGLDSLLQMPSGCFEQTSSTTYPNVLALHYLRSTSQTTAEVEATALGYISEGYQRLLSFEVQGGGFEWFGNAPAHRILSAYGLLEFSDMSEVYDVDPAVIERTQTWLVSQQEQDGRFRAAPEGIHEGATNNFTDSDLRATAYIAYALLESGYTGAPVDNAVNWVRDNLSDIDDNYTLALVANMFLSSDSNDPTARNLLDQLDEAADREDGRVSWSSDSQSLTYGTGDAMTMETTALALYGFIRAQSHPETVEGGIDYLVGNKDSFGTWQSTQATILSLRTFLALLENSSDPANADVAVLLDGVEVASYSIDESNSDVFRQVDLRDLVSPGGDYEVELTFDGEGSFLYQVVTRYYTPWDEAVGSPTPLDITVSYPTAPVPVGSTGQVGVHVASAMAERADMVMVEVGVPPGFDVDMRTLQNQVASGAFSRVDRTGSGIEAYLYGLDPAQTLDFTFDIVPRFPMTVQAPESRTYLYYEPTVEAVSEPATVSAE